MKYLLSGPLRCSACQANSVLSNGLRCQCATHVNCDACGVTLSVSRERAERVILNCVETDLLDPIRLAKIEERYRAAATRPVADHSRRIQELDGEVKTFFDAVARGLVSDALATRLGAAEAERARGVGGRSSSTA